jgi:hypothetical protein
MVGLLSFQHRQQIAKCRRMLGQGRRHCRQELIDWLTISVVHC